LRYSYVILFGLCSKIAFSQNDTALIKTYYSNGKIFQEYQAILPDSTPIGNFKSYNTYGTVASEGSYSKGNKVGIWTYLSNGAMASEVVQKYNYDKQEEIYFNYNFEEARGMPRFPGGRSEFENYVAKEVNKKVSKELRDNYKGKTIAVSFQIDKKTAQVINVKIWGYHPSTEINSGNIEDLLIAIVQGSPKWILSKNMTTNTVTAFSLPIKL
jgi:hypothetical protein